MCVQVFLSVYHRSVGEWQEGGGQLLSLTTPHLDKFKAAGGKSSLQNLR